MFDFAQQLSLVPAQSVMCVGDLMLDSFIYGDVVRISPEAATPVVAARREDTMIGGAGNVARNICSLGARCMFVGMIGEDEAGAAIERGFQAHGGRLDARLVVDRSRPTTKKVRFVSEQHSTHLLRVDWELAEPASAEIEAALIARAQAAIPEVGAVVLSDYAKGTLTPRVVAAIIEAARAAGKPVIVDPKARDFGVYRGCTLITPNSRELAEESRRATGSDGEVADAARQLCERLECEAVVVTRGDAGVTLHEQGRGPVHVPAYRVRVRDVSGAGDTVVATLATFLAGGADYESAVRAANAAASVVVGKHGTASVSLEELRARILPAAIDAPAKILRDEGALAARVAEWRLGGLRVGFTNGCFDLLHPGHVKVLTQARAACDRLIVGLNSDASVTRLKGPSRPLQDQHARAELLAALEAVDAVVVFDEDTPIELIRRIKPQVLVKGGDYRREDVVGGDFVESHGGEVVLVDLAPGHSSTRLFERSRSSGAAE